MTGPPASPLLADVVLTSQQRHDVEARFRRDICVMRERLKRPRHQSETREQFYERLFAQFEAILEHYKHLFTGWRHDGRRGRTPRFDDEPTAPVGRPKQHDVNDEDLVTLVENWKAQVKRERHENIPDTQAIAQLLHHHAPRHIRDQIDFHLADNLQRAETTYAQRDALRKAIVEVTVTQPRDFEWWVKRLDRARRNLRRRS